MFLDCTLGSPGHVDIKFAARLDHLDNQIGRAKVVTKEFSLKFTLKRTKKNLEIFIRFFRSDIRVLYVELPPKRIYISKILNKIFFVKIHIIL